MRAARQSADDAGDGRDAVPEARARVVGVRDRRRGHAAGAAATPPTREERPLGRIRNTKQLLRTAALIMSVMLMGSSLATAVLIPAGCVSARPSGRRPRARVSGARADRHRLRHGLRRRDGRRSSGSRARRRWPACSIWSRAICRATAWRPSGRGRPGRSWSIFTGITVLVTIIFDANVDAQGGAYATGVLVLMSSAALAVALTAWRQRRHWVPFGADLAGVHLHHRHQHLRAAGRDQDRVVLHPDHHRHLARVAGAALDRAARARHSEPDEAASAIHRRLGEARRGRPDHREPAAVRTPSRNTSTSCAKRPTRTACRRTTRCCFSKSVPGDASQFSEDARRPGRAGRPATGPPVPEPGHSQRDRRAAALHPGPDRSDSPRLLRVDGRQPDHVSAEVPGVRRRRYGAGDPRGAAAVRTRPARRPRVHVG